MYRRLRRPAKRRPSARRTTARRSTTSSSMSSVRSSMTSGCRRRPPSPGQRSASRRSRAGRTALRRRQGPAHQDVSDDILGYGPIDRLLKDEEVSEVMLQQRARRRLRARRQLERRAPASSTKYIFAASSTRSWARSDAASTNRTRCATPVARRSRVNAVVHPLAVGGPFLTSKFAKEKLQVDDLIRYGTLSATQPASFRPAWSAD